MSATVVRVLGSSMEGPFARHMYIESFDVEAFGGYGKAVLTYDVDEAHVFADPGEALTALRQQSTSMPFRADGYPNRPLMAYTSEVLALATAKAEDARAWR